VTDYPRMIAELNRTEPVGDVCREAAARVNETVGILLGRRPPERPVTHFFR
jgi:hypothetical protein